MSGHSHYATTHRQKELKDAVKGKVFSKLARAITIAVKTGGGNNPDSNLSLRVAIEKARQASMPKDNIERAISKGAGGEAMEQVVYEGFGPSGVGVIVDAGTDNRNRTGQEIKNLFDRVGGKMAGPGAVSFNFEHKGMIVVNKKTNPDDDMLVLIDLGAEDVEEMEDGYEVYVKPSELYEVKGKVEQGGFTVTHAELTMKPKTYYTVQSVEEANKIVRFLNTIEDHDDVQKVYTNVDIPQEFAESLE